ncbi:exonuclease SbcCD subunit D [soil metagenome]
MNFCFVHAADLHLDTPFQGLGRVNDALAERLRDASLEAFDRLVRLTLERDAAFLVLAGDIYDGAARGLRAQLRFRDGLDRLSRSGVSSLVIHGNHDPLDGWSAVSQWPERVTVFGSDAVDAVPVERDGVRLATVYGVSYGAREVTENLALRFRRQDAPGVHVALLHASVDGIGANEHGTYSPCTVDDLRASGMDYWAMGHIHRRAILRAGEPWVVYPGNLQGRSMKPSEQGAKGAMVVHVEDGVIARTEFVACDCVRFGTAEVPVGEYADLPALTEGILDQLDRLAEGMDGCDLLARVRLTGRGELNHDLRRANVLPELQRTIREALAARGRGIWCERVLDETRPALELDRIRGRGDLAAEVLRWADDLSACEDQRQRFVGVQWEALRRAGLEPAEPHEVEALLNQAVELALGMLDEEAAQ